METMPSSALDDHEYLYGQAFYPVTPFSWLAPLWSFLCGVIASAAWAWTSNSVLRLFWGLLLTGPLLGTVWGAGTRIRQHAQQGDCLPDGAEPKSIWALPYTLIGSTSYRFAARLCFLVTWWREAKPVVSRALVQWITGTVFALAVAAQLGQQSIAITALGLVMAYAVGFSRWQWIAHPVIFIAVPLCLAWLLGHAAFAVLNPLSIVVAVCFACVFYGCFITNQIDQGLIWQVMPQAVVIAVLLACNQPVVAAAVTLLGSPQLLLAQLLRTREQRGKYFQAIQWHVAVSMLLTALALRYKP